MRKFLMFFAFLMLSGIFVFAQKRTVTGTVKDENGNPVPFATVTETGTRNATTADANGNFSFKMRGDGSITFSATGYAAAAVNPDGNAAAPVLRRTNSELSTVVVTAQGIRREAKSLGYSTATVNSEQLNMSKPINVAQGLTAQVSGAQVSVINNGVDPQIRVQLRGERHINSDNQPLFIVDGMEVRSDFIALLNPEDVESMSVLKSASAAALYGSEATNGVIIITTKKGSRNGKSTVNVTQTTTAERLAYTPQIQQQFGGYGGESGTFFGGTPYEFNANNQYTGFTNYIPFENQSYGPEFNGQPSYVGVPNAQGKVDSVPYAPRSKTILNQFFHTGITSQTDFSISNGDAKNSNIISLQYVDVNGVTPKDVSKRANVRFGGRRTIGIFSYDYSADYTSKYSNTVGTDITQGWPIYWTLLNTPANIPLSQLKNWQDPNSFGNLSNYPNAYYINPWWQIDNARDIAKSDNIQGVVSLGLKPASWVNITYRLSAQVSNTIYKGYRNEADFSPYSQSAFGPPIYGTPYSGNISGALADQTLLQKRLQQDFLVTLDKKFGDLNTTLILGNTIWDRYANYQTQSVGNNVGTFNGSQIVGGSPQSQTSGLVLPGIYNIAYYYGIPSTEGYISDTRLIGAFGDLTLGYKDQLFLHGNYRQDWSSLLATGNNTYSVYGGDLSWIFSSLAPFRNTFIDYGKLRGAYSHTGQITLGPYSTVNTFNITGGYPYGGLSSLTLSGNYNNPANVPEATNEIEAGIELGILKSRVTVGATYYHDNNFNQLFPVTVTSSTGYTSANVNAANTVSEGWEFDAKTAIVRTPKFRWEVNGNFAIQTTTVKSLYGTGSNKTLQTGIGNYNEAIVGQPFPVLYVSDLVRDSANGKVIVDGTTGYPSLSNSSVNAGRTTPKYILGLTSTFSYGGFTLQVIGDYRGGYVFYNAAEKSLDFTGATTHTTTNGRQNFIYPNSEVLVNGKLQPNTNVYTKDGNLGFWVSSQFTAAQTTYIENAAAWKVRTITLSYDFTKFLSHQKILKGAKLTALCNNVLMFRPSQNNFTDPEFNATNANGLGYNTFYQLPPTRQYSVIVNLTF